MLNELARQFSVQIETFLYLMTLINALLHVIFAGAVARNAGNLARIGQKPVLVSAATWAFATLIGGVFTATIYWLLHYSTLTRPTSLMRDMNYDKT
jgi:uncharacterized membrane protein